MGYSYEVEKQRIFTEDGQVAFLKVRDKVQAILKLGGAFREQELGTGGDSWLAMACVDRLVELGEIEPLRPPDSCWRQYQVYATKQVHNF